MTEDQLKKEAYKFSVEAIVKYKNNIQDKFAEQPTKMTIIDEQSIEIISYYSEIKNYGTANAFCTFKCLVIHSQNDLKKIINWSVEIIEIGGMNIKESINVEDSKKHRKSKFKSTLFIGEQESITLRNHYKFRKNSVLLFSFIILITIFLFKFIFVEDKKEHILQSVNALPKIELNNAEQKVVPYIQSLSSIAGFNFSTFSNKLLSLGFNSSQDCYPKENSGQETCEWNFDLETENSKYNITVFGCKYP